MQSLKKYVKQIMLTNLGKLAYQDETTINEIKLDDSPSSDHTATGIKITLTAGESLVFGDLCYFKSDGKCWKAAANASSTMPGLFLCLGTISVDASGVFLVLGVARDDTWAWTVGGVIYTSITAGDMTQTSPSSTGDQIQIVGVATHADRIVFNPNLATAEVT